MFAFFVTALFWLPAMSVSTSATDFVKPESVLSENPNQVTLGLIMVNINHTKSRTEDLFKERCFVVVVGVLLLFCCCFVVSLLFFCCCGSRKRLLVSDLSLG